MDLRIHNSTHARQTYWNNFACLAFGWGGRWWWVGNLK